MDLIYTSELIKIIFHFMGDIMHKAALRNNVLRLCSSHRYPTGRRHWTVDSKGLELQKSAGLPPNGPASLSVYECCMNIWTISQLVMAFLESSLSHHNYAHLEWILHQTPAVL